MRKVSVDITLPVLNEERTLEKNVRMLLGEISSGFSFDWSLTIVDNGSSDDSWKIASRLARTEANIRALRLGQRGRGGALKAAWSSSSADIMAYMDIDLSTELEALAPLLDPIAAGTVDVSIGSRLSSGSEVTRSARREAISHLYNLIARAALRYPIRDAQCGFKAVSRQTVQSIVPAIEDDSWFFDTELLVLAWRAGLRINEVPVRWVEDDDSRVRVVSTAIDDLRGIWRLVRRSKTRPADSPVGTMARITVVESVQAALSSTEEPSSAPVADKP